MASTNRSAEKWPIREAIENMQSQTTDAWQLIESGQYELAVEVYSRFYQEDGRPFNLRNRGIAHLNMDNYTSALADFKLELAITDSKFLDSGVYIFQGVCYWNLNQPFEAIHVWREALSTPYTDAAGGIEPSLLLLYTAERLDDSGLRQEALHLLRKHTRRKVVEWPGPLGSFVLGRTNLDELARDVGDTKLTTLVERRQCQAEFYVALQALRKGDWSSFQNSISRCAASRQGYLEHEYYLARWEVKHGFPKPAFR
ncbi:MAG: hypothetical protein HY782_04365 [Chloroflexi bacterium]|nr:hypothetical protein [Chloroflexota bacterium]